MREQVDICIVGGGVVGLFAALNHINAGKKVRLIDKQYAGSSRFNLGEIMLQGYPEDFLPFVAYSRSLWKEAEETLGQDVGYDRMGGFRLALSNRDVKKIKESTEQEKAFGFESEWIEDPERIKQLMGINDLPNKLKGVKYSLHDAVIDTRHALDSLRTMLIQKGLMIWGSDTVEEFIEENGEIIGVKTDSGDECVANSILIAQGIRAGDLLQKADVHLPIRPARVHILEMRPTENMPIQIIDHRERYGDIVFKYNAKTGRVILSYTAQRDPAQATYSLDEDRQMLEWLKRRAGEMMPSMANAQVLETHVVSIGVTPDRRPYIGQIEKHKRLFVASGMNGRSYAFAAGVAGYVGAIMRGESSPLQPEHIASFEPSTGRFGKKNKRIEAIRANGGVTF